MGGGGVEGAAAAGWGAGMEWITTEVGIYRCAMGKNDGEIKVLN